MVKKKKEYMWQKSDKESKQTKKLFRSFLKPDKYKNNM